MKKEYIIRVLFFILGALVFGGISFVFAFDFSADNVSYTPIDTTWNVDNVKDAIDNLHDFNNNNKFVGGGLMNTDRGTTWVNITDNFTYNPLLASVENGVFTLKKDGRIRVCGTSKGHGKDNNSNARLYHNSTLIYQITARNEIYRCDEFDVLKGDIVNYQFASNNVGGMMWSLGSLYIYYVK